MDSGLVLPDSILVDVGDGCDGSTVGAFAFASIGVFVDPLPVVVSCLFGCSILHLSPSFKELNASAFCNFATYASIENRVQIV